eukprot:3103622-Rhodomonas_salina.1
MPAPVLTWRTRMHTPACPYVRSGTDALYLDASSTVSLGVFGTDAGYQDTVRECYLQSVRWQWGAIDVGYLIVQVRCFL